MTISSDVVTLLLVSNLVVPARTHWEESKGKTDEEMEEPGNCILASAKAQLEEEAVEQEK